MSWHYCMDFLSFPKLKQFALNGKIPKKLAKLKPSKCAGCLFGVMTKLPWRSKELTSSHKDKVLVATKPGAPVSVDQMTLTKVDFFCPIEGETHQQAVLMLRKHLRSLPPSMASAFYTTTVIKFASKHGISILHYHCDNIQLAINPFKQACHNSHAHDPHFQSTLPHLRHC
jgi:hypothetical protein